jgi:hypothetical protein
VLGAVAGHQLAAAGAEADARHLRVAHLRAAATAGGCGRARLGWARAAAAARHPPPGAGAARSAHLAEERGGAQRLQVLAAQVAGRVAADPLRLVHGAGARGRRVDHPPVVQAHCGGGRRAARAAARQERRRVPCARWSIKQPRRCCERRQLVRTHCARSSPSASPPAAAKTQGRVGSTASECKGTRLILPCRRSASWPAARGRWGGLSAGCGWAAQRARAPGS